MSDVYGQVSPAAGGYVGAREETAGFWIRAVAIIIDWIVLGIVSAILYGILGQESGAAHALNTLIGIAYYVGMWTYNNGQTLGHQVLKLRVVRMDGQPITLGTAVIRYIGYIVNTLTLFIGWLMAFGSEHRTIADRMAGTRVIKVG